MFSRVLFSFCNSLLSRASQVNSGCLGLSKLLALFHQCSLLGSTYIILYTTIWKLFKTVSRGNQRAHLIYIQFLGDLYALLTNNVLKNIVSLIFPSFLGCFGWEYKFGPCYSILYGRRSSLQTLIWIWSLLILSFWLLERVYQLPDIDFKELI